MSTPMPQWLREKIAEDGDLSREQAAWVLCVSQISLEELERRCIGPKFKVDPTSDEIVYPIAELNSFIQRNRWGQ